MTDNGIQVLKDKLARAARVMEMAGLLDFSGHISGRVPGSRTFFINPMQLSRSEVTPDDLAEVSLEGQWVGGKLEPPQEMPIHAAVYQARGKINSVAHIHCHYAILPSIAGVDLVPVCQHGSIFGAVVPVYGEADKITTFEEAGRMADALGDSRAVIMKGHGAVVAESSVEATFVASLHLEENARLFVEASVLGRPQPLTPQQIERAAQKTFLPTVSIQKTWDYYLGKGRKAGIFWD
ncbi:MAG: class II aldolase/adducin family protein [Desulfobacterales bacterium]|nr:class II aldolase/adducin family protein [Desulfobacterales bacterium]